MPRAYVATDLPSQTRNARQPSSNFAFLSVHDEQLVGYGEEAERYVTSSANTCLLKLRQFAELLAQLAAANTGRYQEWNEPFAPLLNRLCDGGVLPPRETLIFHSLRKAGNSANHSHDGGENIRESREALKGAHELGIWFHRRFGPDPEFEPEPFQMPRDPNAYPAVLHEEVKRARQRVVSEGRKRRSAEERAQWEARQRVIWEQRAGEAERRRIEIEKRLRRLQAEARSKPSVEPRSLPVESIATPHAQARPPSMPHSRPTHRSRSEHLPGRNWTVSEIRHLVLNKDAALERAIITLYARRKFASGDDFQLARQCYSSINERKTLSRELRTQARLAIVSRYATELAVAANGCYDYRDLERRGLYR